jgi:zinc protease
MIDGVTPPAIEAAAKKYLVADRLHVVAVGDKAKIVPQIEQLKLDLGAPELRDANGEIVK